MTQQDDHRVMLTAAGNRVILRMRGGFLKRRQEPAVTPPLWARDDGLTQPQWNQ